MNQPQLFNFKGQQVRTAKQNDYLGYFYVLECTDVLKIGSTRNPYVRLSQLRRTLQNYGNHQLIKMYVSSPCTNYKDNEVLLQDRFSKSRLKGTELFKTDIHQVLRVARQLKLENNSESLKEDAKDTFEFFKDLVLTGGKKYESN